MATVGRPREFDETEALEKAMALFWRKGYEATGMSELMEAMGLARQSIYNTFGSKRDLYLRALEHYTATSVQGVLSMLQAPGSPRANIETVIRLWGAPEAPDDGCLIVNAGAEFGRADAAVAAFLRHHVSSAAHAFRHAIERAQEAGEVSTDLDAASIGATLFSIATGLNVLRRLGAPAEVIDGSVAGALRLLDA